jgi:hypothetical protein
MSRRGQQMRFRSPARLKIHGSDLLVEFVLWLVRGLREVDVPLKPLRGYQTGLRATAGHFLRSKSRVTDPQTGQFPSAGRISFARHQ